MFHLSVVLILAVAVTTAVAAPQATTPAAPSSSLSLRDDVTLLSVTDKELQDFLLERVAVEEFTECFLGSVSCKSVGAKSLIKQIASLGLGGECGKCSKKQQERVHMVVFDFIKSYMLKYPQHWRRVVPNLTNLFMI